MDAFSLLKYWRGAGGGGGGGVASGGASDATSPSSRTPNSNGTTTTTMLTATAVAQNAIETDDENDEDDDDDGPFFDLEFTVPDEADDSEDGPDNLNGNNSDSGSNSVHHIEEEEEEDDNEESEGDDGEREFKFTLSPSSNDRSDPNLSLSPSDDLFFKGKLVQVEPSSSFELNSSEPNSKPQFTASLLKSATKFRVFMSGLKKPKSNIVASEKEPNGSDSVAPNPKQQPESAKKQQQQRKFFTVKFKVEEVPIMSLFTRDNSSRGASGNKSQNQKHNADESPSASDEKRFSKEAMHKYLKMVKPLYIRVSRRYGDKLGFSGQLKLSSGGKAAEEPPPTTAAQKPAPAKTVTEKTQSRTEGDAPETTGTNMKSQKQGNLPAGLRIVCKHLGKSRSASSAAVVAAAPSGIVSSRRRDDSLLQQQDGIQGAILHCKRSFNATRECESSHQQLPRSVSDPLHETSSELSRKSTNEGKDKRL